MLHFPLFLQTIFFPHWWLCSCKCVWLGVMKSLLKAEPMCSALVRIKGFSFALRCKGAQQQCDVSLKREVPLAHLLYISSQYYNPPLPLFCWVQASHWAALISQHDPPPPLLSGAIKAPVFDLTMNKIQKCFVILSVESSSLFLSFFIQIICQTESWQKVKKLALSQRSH